MSLFKFKQFHIQQDPKVFKVGTDAVLLGASVLLDSSKHILDIGTGTGIIALMLAQRFPQAQITGIDQGKEQYLCSQFNFKNSPYKDRLHAMHCEVSEIPEEDKFDLVVCNPPYFEDALLPDAIENKVSKHIAKNGLLKWMLHAKEHLATTGKLYYILPYQQSLHVQAQLEKEGFHCTYKKTIQSFKAQEPVRQIVGFSLEQSKDFLEEELVIYTSPRNYSEAYRKLTKDFHPFL